MATNIRGTSKDEALNGTSGDDIIFGAAGNDTLNGLSGNEQLFGESGDDRLEGSNGNDLLDGGNGDDRLFGGSGNDTYVINNRRDEIDEGSNQGFDEVQSFVTYTLGSNLEDLILQGNANINGTGNGLNNILTGNRGSNVLRGLGGDDRISGGVSGNDVLDGGAGNDILVGNRGDNRFVIDSKGDRVLDAGRGIDTVETSVNYVLPGDVENCTLKGKARSGTGNRLNNEITGSSKNDTLTGGNGADTLTGGRGNDAISGGGDSDDISGGAGNDTLTGGASRDLFFYTSDRTSNSSDFGRDRIVDFQVGLDVIVVSKKAFGLNSIPATIFSQSSEFAVVANNAQAARSSARLVFSQGSRTLFFNTNGTSSGFGSSGRSGALITFNTENLSDRDFLIVG